jgi:hypothetical protein
MALDPITNPPGCISNADKITALYGGWPRFHDAEVWSLHFDRAPDRNTKSPTLVARILALHADRTQTDEKGYWKVIGKYLVTFRFLRIEDLQMTDFNHQNVLAGIYIDEKPEGIEVTLDGIFGAHLEFRCYSVIVDDVTHQ